MMLGVLCSLIFLGVPFLYCFLSSVCSFLILFMFVLTGPVLLELMMSDFSPVPFVFINIISRGEEGMMLFFVCYNPNCGHRWRD